MKVLIFDSGTLITLSINCILNVITGLKSNFNGKFLITKEVENEIIKRPLNIKKFKLGAMRLKVLIEDKILEFPDSIGINHNEISNIGINFMNSANTTFFVENKPIHIIDLGEASILGLTKILNKKGIENIIAMDERTTRMLCEKPENLRKLLEKKLHHKIKINKNKVQDFSNIKFIRSTELIYVAYKKGIFKNQSKEFLDALLYGAKFKGAAISSDEIKEIEEL
ncbi:MAG: hypothetical protein QW727_01625 [Candidatus Pacearchaeota archaeon]